MNDPTDPDALVRAFCDAWNRGDVDDIMSYFAPDATYHNIPMDPVVGVDAIRQVIDGFFAMSDSIEFVTHRQIADGGLVMNERTDTFVTDGNATALPVCGVFEVGDDGITAWRDYFDMGQLGLG